MLEKQIETNTKEYIPIYRDGELDKYYLYKYHAERVLRALGRFVVEFGHDLGDALDELVVTPDKQ